MLHGTYCVWVQYHIVSNHFSQTRGCMARSTISIKCMQQRGKQGQERVNKRLKTMIRKTDSMTSTKFCAPNLAYWLANIGNFQPYSSRRVLPTRFKSLCSSFGPCGRCRVMFPHLPDANPTRGPSRSSTRTPIRAIAYELVRRIRLLGRYLHSRIRPISQNHTTGYPIGL